MSSSDAYRRRVSSRHAVCSNYVKSRSKHVGVAEFRRGSPADFPAKGTSSRLKIAADFVVQVYEAELLRRNLAYRAETDYSTQVSGAENVY